MKKIAMLMGLGLIWLGDGFKRENK